MASQVFRMTCIGMLMLSVGSCGDNAAPDNYANISGPSPAGTVMLVVNTEHDYEIELTNTESGNSARVTQRPTASGIRIEVFADKVLLTNAFTKEEVLELSAEDAALNGVKPSRRDVVKAMLGSSFSWGIASIEHKASEGEVLLTVNFETAQEP